MFINTDFNYLKYCIQGRNLDGWHVIYHRSIAIHNLCIHQLLAGQLAELPAILYNNQIAFYGIANTALATHTHIAIDITITTYFWYGIYNLASYMHATFINVAIAS